jgi:hypothetical protein
MKRSTAVSRRSRFIQVLQLPGTAGLILCIIGAVDQTSAKVSDQKQGKVLLKAGVLVFLAIYLCLVALAAKSATEFNRILAGEKRILVVILVALPLLAVRFTWTLLAYFSNFHTFRIYGGSVVVRIWMATLEELLIVIAFTVIGLMTPKYADTDSNGDETEGFRAQDSLGGIQLEEANWSYQPRGARR